METTNSSSAPVTIAPIGNTDHAIQPNVPRVCVPGTAWTCTVICDPGSRTSAERIFGGSGAEICAVKHCSCEQLPYRGVGAEARQAVDAVDTGLPLAVIVFGIGQLLEGWGKP